MTKLSVVTHFFNNQDRVREQLDEWRRLPFLYRKELEFILVDDCSTENVKFDISNLNAKHLRILNDIPWNQPGARNLGIIYSQSHWLLLHDIDQSFYPQFFPYILNRLACGDLDSEAMYFIRIKHLINSLTGKTKSHHPNSFVVNRSKFISHGMYDEDFSGSYGYDDTYVTNKWRLQGKKQVMINQVFCEGKPFGSNLPKSLERNLELINEKMKRLNQLSSGSSKLRFAWELINSESI